jgi:hypothetical protein
VCRLSDGPVPWPKETYRLRYVSLSVSRCNSNPDAYNEQVGKILRKVRNSMAENLTSR